MDRYADIRILRDPEFPSHQLMAALFAKLHRCLARLRSNDIGVSFPEVDANKPDLGAVLRVHGSEASLKRLMDEPWLKGMHDHIELGAVSPVPGDARFVRVRRVQVKSSAERIRRRQMKRKGWTEEEALLKVPDTAQRTLSLPFLNLESGSTGHRFNLFVEHIVAEAQQSGTFNAYGLSASATLPWF